MYSPIQGTGKLEIISIDGRNIGQSIAIEIKQGMQAWSVHLPEELTSGIYALKITTPFSSILHPIHIVH